MFLRGTSLLFLASTFLSGAILLAQTPPSSTKKTGADEETCVLSGMVIRQLDSAPLKGAQVRLFSSEDRQHTIAIRTAADGRFELKNVPAGQYRLMVTRNGYFAVEYGQKKPSDPGATFSLRPRQRMSDLVFKLGRASVITGHIYDADGDPMPGVIVAALRSSYQNGRKQLGVVAQNESNDLGEFRLYGLSPGRYCVSAETTNWSRVVGDRQFSGEDKGSGEKGYTKNYYPGTTDQGKASVIIVKEGDEIPATDILMKEVAVYRVRGKVANLVSSRGTQQIHVEVFRRNQRNDWISFSSQNMVKPDGSFEVPEIAPGEYTIHAMLFEDGKIFTTQQNFDVTAADVDGMDLSIGPGVAIPGRITWDGKPSLSGDELNVFLSSEQARFEVSKSSSVDENNLFLLKEVPDGQFKVGIWGLSKDCYIKEVKYGEGVLPDVEFHVTKGAGSELEVTVSSRGARIEGTVLSEEALPVAGVWAVAVPEENKRKILRLYEADRTDQYGHFVLRGLAPGKYKLFSWDGVEQGEWEDEDFLKEFEDKGVTMEVQDADGKTAELKLIQVKESSTKTD